MGSAVVFRFAEDEGVEGERWASFCAAHSIVHSPATIGGNIFYAGEVEVTFGEHSYGSIPEYAEYVSFSTYFLGSAMPEAVTLALAFWLEFGGAMDADPELRGLIVGKRTAAPPKAASASASASATGCPDSRRRPRPQLSAG
jgi:hypothetical protein